VIYACRLEAIATGVRLGDRLSPQWHVTWSTIAEAHCQGNAEPQLPAQFQAVVEVLTVRTFADDLLLSYCRMICS
jgi:hypothetical protein